jgi:hypothetical protein
MRTFFAPLAAIALSTAFLGVATPANAGIVESCGVDISAGSQCEMRVEGGCTASCTPVNFTAQCSADLYVGCNGMCTATVDVGCTTTCTAACETQCQVEPAKFDCAASCRADCGASCDARCAGAADGNRCRSSCNSTCSGECEARCSATPPSADCKTKCDASCNGSCKADANMDCQIDCQAKSFVSCETDLQGGCETACSKPDGALFCDGQYVDVGDKLDQCVADLKAMRNAAMANARLKAELVSRAPKAPALVVLIHPPELSAFSALSPHSALPSAAARTNAFEPLPD